MKAQHLRRAPYRPRLELAIGILGLAICVLGIRLVTAGVLEKTPAEVRLQEPTTTTTMISSSVVEPETTTTVEPTATTMPRPVGRLPAPVLKKTAATAAPSSSTTTTTEAPKTPLEVALKYLGQTGPWADWGSIVRSSSAGLLSRHTSKVSSAGMGRLPYMRAARCSGRRNHRVKSVSSAPNTFLFDWLTLKSQRVLRLARGGYWPAGATDTLKYCPALVIDEARKKLLSIPKHQCPGDNLARRVQCGEPRYELATHEE
jgi:hypothetical protein